LPSLRPAEKRRPFQALALLVSLGALLYWYFDGAKSLLPTRIDHTTGDQFHDCTRRTPYGLFPKQNDPLRLLPCTSTTLPPPLDDEHPERTWAALFDPNPDNWSWGNKSSTDFTQNSIEDTDPYAGRGIYLCGYLDVPLDYTNESDPRIARLAITKYQVSGLGRTEHSQQSLPSSAGHKSERTIVIEPGGPGGSGTEFVWRAAEKVTDRLSLGQFDVLGWDPRGVNTSLPAATCFPFDADRDRWSLLTSQYRHSVAGSPWTQLELADAMNNATFAACKETLGDLPRLVSTAFVARDVEQIRIALGEPELTGYFVSYGTGIGQTYVNMFPDRVGHLIMDGTEYVRDHRLLGGFGWTALDNATDAWHDGFLGECITAGPEYCALAQPQHEKSEPVTLSDLKHRTTSLLDSVAELPMPAYTKSSGPSLVTYSRLVGAIYQSLYQPGTWPTMARALYDLELGNSSLIAQMLDDQYWEYQPRSPCPIPGKASSDELGKLVICADSYDAPLPPFDGSGDGLDWWSSLWQNMTSKSWVSGDSRFQSVFSCRHYTEHFGSPAEVYRGDLNNTLSHPVLLIAEVYDPATPLRNGRRLLNEMGSNARLIAHHGYGHSSQPDVSTCTDELARAYILRGELPDDPETACYADEKPYRFSRSSAASHESMLRVWHEHKRELSSSHPGLVL